MDWLPKPARMAALVIASIISICVVFWGAVAAAEAKAEKIARAEINSAVLALLQSSEFREWRAESKDTRERVIRIEEALKR